MLPIAFLVAVEILITVDNTKTYKVRYNKIGNKYGVPPIRIFLIAENNKLII